MKPRRRAHVPVSPLDAQTARTVVDTDPRYQLAVEQLAMATGRKGTPIGEERAKAIVTDALVKLQTTLAGDLAPEITKRGRRLNELRAELTGILRDVDRVVGARFTSDPEMVLAELRKALRPDRLPDLLAEIDDADRAFRKAADPSPVKVAIEGGMGGLGTLDLELTTQEPDILSRPFDTPGQAAADPTELPEIAAELRRLKARRRREVKAGKPTDATDVEIARTEQLQAETRAEQEEIELGPAPPSMREQDRLQRQRAKEVRHGAIHDPGRLVVDAEAARWAAVALPEGSRHHTSRVPMQTEADMLAWEALAPVDHNFAAAGYEVQVTLPDGTAFRADGIEYRNDDGSRYRLREHKEVYDETRAYYFEEEGEDKLKAMLDKHARIAAQLEPYGCTGWVYSTGHDRLDEFLETYIRENEGPGWDMLRAGGAVE